MRLQEPVSSQRCRTRIISGCADGDARLRRERIYNIFPVLVCVERTRHHIKVTCLDTGCGGAPADEVAQGRPGCEFGVMVGYICNDTARRGVCGDYIIKWAIVIVLK